MPSGRQVTVAGVAHDHRQRHRPREVAVVGQVVEHGLAGELAVGLQRQEGRAHPTRAEEEVHSHVPPAVVDPRDPVRAPHRARGSEHERLVGVVRRLGGRLDARDGPVPGEGHERPVETRLRSGVAVEGHDPVMEDRARLEALEPGRDRHGRRACGDRSRDRLRAVRGRRAVLEVVRRDLLVRVDHRGQRRRVLAE
jgi:hypothetical protein